MTGGPLPPNPAGNSLSAKKLDVPVMGAQSLGEPAELWSTDSDFSSFLPS